MRRLFLCILVALSHYTFAQQKGRYLDREIQIEVDNDAFTLNVFRDQYYSQGSYGRYRVVDTTGFKKKVKAIGINHRIYTPDAIWLTEVEDFDRPYAGQLSATGTLTYYDKKSVMEYALEAGVMGKAALAEPIQKGWHKFFGMGEPLGWDYQMNNAPILNGYFKYAHLLVRAGNVQILAESNIAAGTDFTYARQEVVLRLGKFKDLDESVQYGGNLGHRQKKSSDTQETIVFVSFGPEYVFYNSTIEGNLLGKPSVHLEERVPWVTGGRIGGLFAWSSFDLAVIYYFRSIDVVGTEKHSWVGIKLTQRF